MGVKKLFGKSPFEQHFWFQGASLTWQFTVTVHSIRNSCDVLKNSSEKIKLTKRQKCLWGWCPPVAGMWGHYSVMLPFDFITPHCITTNICPYHSPVQPLQYFSNSLNCICSERLGVFPTFLLQYFCSTRMKCPQYLSILFLPSTTFLLYYISWDLPTFVQITRPGLYNNKQDQNLGNYFMKTRSQDNFHDSLSPFLKGRRNVIVWHPIMT